MSLLRFKIQDYHAIKSADIKIDGITVLAGENGSGKSTLSRWIYYLINSMVRFEDYCLSTLYSELYGELRRFIRLSSDWRYRESIYRIEKKYHFNGDEFKSYLYQVVLSLKDSVVTLLNNDNTVITRKRILFLIGKEDMADLDNMDNVRLEEAISDYFEHFIQEYTNKYYQTKSRIAEKNYKDLYEAIANTYNTSDDFPRIFTLFEKEESLFVDNTFLEPYFFNKVIYIDASIPTPDGDRPDADVIGNKTRDLILSSLSKELDQNAQKILLRMQRIINGSIVLKESEALYHSKELRYARRDGLDIPLRSAASGIQAIAYLYRLLESGVLDANTLLLVDEPETHLHPQWVVEYANILVSLQKEMGVKIVIASHSPDMVSAIETISRRHQLENQTRFYQARQESDMKYVFDDLQNNIAGIFESFNVAFSKMQDYGADL